jgi:hypothetical protein
MNFVKAYPEVIVALLSILTTLIVAVVGWAMTSTLQAIKDSLHDVKKEAIADRTELKDQGERISKIEGACEARHMAVH